ncbi:PP2C family protein-serine/threonine phosphatase [Brevibacillus massiliensis]|jgi:sigma-B regulation protein RsbU (phosphoserine phosphatase)|uniref:PP2C family protein-serine/threonine phosphatase n=1 Tax=Brevibacillus massiliensis TaxID=1118054 RepID=UPI00031C3CD5|nr:PP2C family protein-serine/threonine phosphatase [Brevibacillus massiliensis]
MARQEWEDEYRKILQAFLRGRGEDQLYLGQQLSKWLRAHHVAPEEIVDFHVRALAETVELPELVKDSFQLLTEVMIEYGIAFREYRSLRSRQQQLESEIEVAATMQQTLLPRTSPQFDQVEIGLISVPAKQMSGDYYNFAKHDDQVFSVALADIIGKGIPAALCMSMIKYAMDSFLDQRITPAAMLGRLNGVVERNIEPGMFITMFYGMYDTCLHRFRYAVAGHEPGFWYRASKGRLYDLESRGLVLGVTPDVDYQEYEIDIEPGDLLILMTDGVTERKVGGRFLQRENIADLIQAEIGSPAQQIAENLYRKLLLLSNLELPDDHTMIVIRRVV